MYIYIYVYIYICCNSETIHFEVLPPTEHGRHEQLCPWMEDTTYTMYPLKGMDRPDFRRQSILGIIPFRGTESL